MYVKMTPILNQIKHIKLELIKTTTELKNRIFPFLMKHSEDQFGYYKSCHLHTGNIFIYFVNMRKLDGGKHRFCYPN